MIVYCHEYSSDRWSFHPYVDHLRDLGFDLFTFDFRNHGDERSRAGLRSDAMDDRPRGPRPACVLWPICGRGPIMIRRVSGSSGSAGAERRP